jgi:hypothetical protein
VAGATDPDHLPLDGCPQEFNRRIKTQTLLPSAETAAIALRSDLDLAA